MQQTVERRGATRRPVGVTYFYAITPDASSAWVAGGSEPRPKITDEWLIGSFVARSRAAAVGMVEQVRDAAARRMRR
jgi:hypothetical protein